jgi:hypothetical protein
MDDGRDQQQEAWQEELMQDRYRETCDAINRCAKAGADLDALKTLCRETGIDIRHTLLGDEIRITTRRAA